MWRWIRPFHERTCAHLPAFSHTYGAASPADPKRPELCAIQWTVGRGRHGNTLFTIPYYRLRVAPTPDDNLVWGKWIISVLWENEMCVVTAFDIKLNVFFLSDVGAYLIYVMVLVNWLKIQNSFRSCLKKQKMKWTCIVLLQIENNEIQTKTKITEVVTIYHYSDQ